MDSGNLADFSAKLDVITSVMAQLKYDAVGLGQSDVHLGSEFYSAAKANKLTVVDTSPATDKSAVPYLIKNVGGVKVGIVSFGAMPTDTKVDEMQLRKFRFETYKTVRDKCDVLVLLDQANVATDDWLQRNASRLGAPDIVVSGPARQAMTEEQVVGTTHVMPAMMQGKDMAVVDVEFTRGQPAKIAAKRVKLDEKFAEEPNILKRVNEAIIKVSGALPAQAPNLNQNVSSVPVKPYYSPLLCRACHEKQYNDWAQSKHAKALKTLVDQKKTTPDCLPCHSELYRAANRYISTDSPAAGVECATCHMNALPHGLERKQMTTHVKVDPSVCLDCHTKERSPTYDVKTYFPKVVHAIVPPTTTASSK